MLAMFAFAAYRLIPAMKGLFDGVEAIRYNMAALEPLWRDQSALAAPPARGSGRALPLRASIRLEDVHFRYPGGREMALAGIDLEIRPGTACCLVGPTGAGKSTTLDVIIGLLHPDRGRVLIDGLPLTPERLPDWQRSVGYVPQTVYLFDDTVTHNIALGVAEQDIDHACVEHAARIAELHDFIVSDLPQGYATLVGERGANLSGGQRQRIGIARALYHNPALLVLDEATNGLDLVTQGRVLAALRGLPHKTLVIATHRRSVAASCDDIAVLENGRIVARGSFAALTAPDSSHRALLEQTAAEAQP
jgi:ABC-type multidrug transport system fused ATPase/permease subunit